MGSLRTDLPLKLAGSNSWKHTDLYNRRAGSSYPNPNLEEECREEFEALHLARVDAEQRLADHEAVLGPELARLRQMRSSLAPSVLVIQPQLQAAPALSAPLPVLALGPPAAQQTQTTGRMDRRWACSRCWDPVTCRGQTWDRRDGVRKHVLREHRTQPATPLLVDYRRRN